MEGYSKVWKALIVAAGLLLLLALSRASAAENPVLPDPKLTPGDVFPDVNAAQVCVRGYSQSARNVPLEVKNAVYRKYHRRRERGVCCEIDHLVPLSLGGTNDIRNLWPQPSVQARQKDDLETALHWAVCDSRMPLSEAQDCIRNNWYDCRNRCAATDWCRRLLDKAAHKYRHQRHNSYY